VTLAEVFDRGLALQRAGDGRGALGCYREILRHQPAHPETLFLAGQAAWDSGDLPAARTYLEKSAATRPAASVLVALGRLLRQMGLGAEALPHLANATRLAPADAAAWLTRGVAEMECGARPVAEQCFREALRLEPERIEALNLLGVLLSQMGRLQEAEQVFANALELGKDYAPVHDNLGRLRRLQGRAEESIACFRAALALEAKAGTHSNLLLGLHYSRQFAPALIAREHRAWGDLHTQMTAPAGFEVERFAPNRRLRIGYVSPDFCRHAVAHFIEPVLRSHDRAAVEVFAYAEVVAPDAVTARLRRLVDHWRPTLALDDDQLAAQIRADRIDVLVDLAGHTAGNRLPVFVRRPAPVQVTWLGYPDTTGLAAMDYRLTDEHADPVGRTEEFHTERLVRLPASFLCYQPKEQLPEPGELPAQRNGWITFGCFNHLAKWDESVLALWADVLALVPGSRLLLRARGVGDPGVTARLTVFFAGRGIGAERLRFSGAELSDWDQLACYQQVDIALDTFPYHGTTTTCEALWMGVPVVTLAGETHVSRVGVSLLAAIGCEPWVAQTGDEYAAIACELAADLSKLAMTRVGLREQMRRSPLMAAGRFTRDLEQAYRDFWVERCAPVKKTE
jgi:predicted O-linked N-acetylglucosamine transferase (SPINDLY family)